MSANEGQDGRAKITPYRNGPYLVRGPFSLVDQDGNEIEVGRRIVALCRCGRSQTRPFCDGTHKLIGFEADSAPEAQLVGRGGNGSTAGPLSTVPSTENREP